MKCLYQIADYDVYSFALMPIDSKMYCILNNTDALVVDPCISGEALEFLKHKQIDNITVFLTHEHIDHISGVNLLRENFKVKVICSQKCAERIRDTRKNLAAYFEGMFSLRTNSEILEIKKLNLTKYTCYADEFFDGEMQYQWHGLTIKCIELPGHSPGSIGIVINNKYIFSGDSFIPGEEVITRLPGGNPRLYKEGTRTFFDKLRKESVVFPGHGEVMTIL